MNNQHLKNEEKAVYLLKKKWKCHKDGYPWVWETPDKLPARYKLEDAWSLQQAQDRSINIGRHK